ncbi:Sensory domain of two-component sensor kinase [Ectothiorhodospira magna]|uniref:Sensory domain of two-component sensor kinase n=1 Tax=Ectothiorhodospira magna TaxID=867345 RepID=A0A1H9AGU1_9GAMM|nr:cache domain-containing protein [Ectothiorhodospira magna]SEP75930.1 Sensory domain of two-component sensor kinase [Ectothiorhodospira magna]
MKIPGDTPRHTALIFKWTLWLVFSLLLTGLSVAFATLNHHNLQRQYEAWRTLDQSRHQQQLQALLHQLEGDLLTQAHLIPSLSGLRQALQQGDPGELGRLFSAHWADFKTDTHLVMAGFLDIHGQFLVQAQLIHTHYDPPAQLWQAVDQALLIDTSSTFVDCKWDCLSYAVTPVLAMGQTVGAVTLAQPVTSLLMSFHTLSGGLDMALFQVAPQRTGAALTDAGQLLGMTRRDELEPLLASAMPAILKSATVTHGQLDDGRQMELMPYLLLEDRAGHRVIAVVITDVTQAQRQMKLAQWQNMLVGIMGLLLMTLAVRRLTRPLFPRR